MNPHAMNILLEKIANMENRQHALETEFIDYAEKNPKGNDSWTEARLRALEDQLKNLSVPPQMVSEPDKMFDLKTFKVVDPLSDRVAVLETAVKELKDMNVRHAIYVTDLLSLSSELERRVAELEKDK